MIFDGPDMIVAESGWAKTAKPRVLRISPDGRVQVLASKGLEGPVTGLLLIDGALYVSHKKRISVIKDGKIERDIVSLCGKKPQSWSSRSGRFPGRSR